MKKVKFKHVADALDYAKKVVSGKIPACRFVKLACKRQLEDLKRWSDSHAPLIPPPSSKKKTKRKIQPYYWDPEKAERICRFIENLSHIKGATGTIVLQPWQVFILTTIFGWVKPDGTRRFRTAYNEIPRKNGKSTMAAGVGLFMLTRDDEPGAEVYSAAVKKDQSKIVFDAAKEMCSKDPELRDFYGVEVLTNSIFVNETASFFKPLSREAGAEEGSNVHCGLVDELHRHKTRETFDVLKTGTAGRAQPLIFIITTAGSDQAGICFQERIYVTKILEGTVVDDTYFGIIFGIDDEDDWRKESSWRKANPNYNISVNPEVIKAEFKNAVEMASAQNTFLTKHLNRWVNADSAWMPIEAWEACKDKSLRIEDFRFEECRAGLDLSTRRDITCKAKIFKRDDIYYGFLDSYLPEDNVHDKAHAETAHYEGWAIDGLLTLTPGNMIDLDFIEESVRDDLSNYEFPKGSYGYDPWQAAQMVGRLMDDDAPMIEVKPNVPNFSEPMKFWEALVIAGKFRHDGNPILTWMVSNVVCHRDAKDNIYPRKQQPKNKIDGVVAMLTAFNRWLAVSEDDGPSVYEERGIVTL